MNLREMSEKIVDKRKEGVQEAKQNKKEVKNKVKGNLKPMADIIAKSMVKIPKVEESGTLADLVNKHVKEIDKNGDMKMMIIKGSTISSPEGSVDKKMISQNGGKPIIITKIGAPKEFDDMGELSMGQRPMGMRPMGLESLSMSSDPLDYLQSILEKRSFLKEKLEMIDQKIREFTQMNSIQ